MTIVIDRSGKGSALTHNEVDGNWDSVCGINEPQTGTSYTVVAADQNRTKEFTNASEITATLTLISTILAAIDTSDFKVTLKNIGAGNVVVTPTTDTFDDGDTTKLLRQNESMTIQNNDAGNKWNVLSTYKTPKGALVYHSSTQAISNITTTLLDFDSEDYDIGGIHNATTSQIEVPAGASRVRISAQVVWPSSGTGYRATTIYKNNSAAYAGKAGSADEPTNSSSLAQFLQTPWLDVVGGTDYFTIKVYHTSGVTETLPAGSTNTWFSMEVME